MRAGDGEPLTSADVRLGADLRAQLTSLYEEGRRISEHFDATVRRHEWHPFVAADYDRVERSLTRLRQPGLRFLEWGSATGVITIMAGMLGFEAYGIELDPDLVAIARDLAGRHGSTARFALGSFLPAGYEWQSDTGDRRLGTIGQGRSGYLELQQPLESFDVVFAYPWSGEEPIMHDLMRCYGGRHARLLLHDTEGVHVYQRGRLVS
jgi:hypothetical protein